MSSVDTSKEEKLIYDLIQNKYDGVLSRYTLEGHILYSLNCSHFKMYHILMNLTDKGFLELVEKSDGEYYQIKK